jgi:hypothetical protein
MIMIVLLIFRASGTGSQDHEYDQDHEQEGGAALRGLLIVREKAECPQ